MTKGRSGCGNNGRYLEDHHPCREGGIGHEHAERVEAGIEGKSVFTLQISEAARV